MNRIRLRCGDTEAAVMWGNSLIFPFNIGFYNVLYLVGKIKVLPGKGKPLCLRSFPT
jgi:hypothetical protein